MKRDGDWVPPMDFIPNTERTPLGGLIAYWVIDTVAVEMREWLEAHSAAHISINIPPDVLGRGGIEYQVTKAGLNDVRQQLVLEVTERGVPDEQGLKALDHMARGGVRIALDDVRLNGVNLALLSRCHFEIDQDDTTLVQELRPDMAPPEWISGLRALIGAARVQVVAKAWRTSISAAPWWTPASAWRRATCSVPRCPRRSSRPSSRRPARCPDATRVCLTMTFEVR